MSSSFSGIDGPLASLYNPKSIKFHLVIYQSVTIHCHPWMMHAIGPKALYLSCCADARKWIFKDEKYLKDFSIDRLRRTTLVLDNSLFSQTFRNDKMSSHECLIFGLKHSQSNVFLFLFELFALLVVYGTFTKHGEQAISDWTDLEINSGAQVTWANKPTTYTHIPVEVK